MRMLLSASSSAGVTPGWNWRAVPEQNCVGQARQPGSRPGVEHSLDAHESEFDSVRIPAHGGIEDFAREIGAILYCLLMCRCAPARDGRLTVGDARVDREGQGGDMAQQLARWRHASWATFPTLSS